MIDWVRAKADALGWPREAVHYEEFLAPQPGKPFEVKLAVSNKVIQVGEAGKPAGSDGTRGR